MLYPKVHYGKHHFCLFLQTVKCVKTIFCGNRQHATDAQKLTCFEPGMFRCQSTPVNIRTGSHSLLIAPPITYYTSDRCYCSILNSTPPSALDFIIPVGFLVFYKMFWFAAERAKEGAFLIRISFRVQLPSYLFPSISFPDSSELPSGAFYVCAVHYGGIQAQYFL